MLQQGPLVIEWPERMASVLPAERLWVTLEYIDDTSRSLRFRSQGVHYQELLAKISTTE
jgi:tRNA threonylcarbamoyladenosine biosynthesis protein TsaE